MALIVQKYGGSSVADLDRIRHVATRVKQKREEGHDMVVIVSARSGVTNRLIDDAQQLHPCPKDRELDMLLSVGEQETIALLSIALNAIGISAISMTGVQAGIITNKSHTKARITKVNASNIKKQIVANHVVIIAGFQGVSPEDAITTLGRGGSDLSAIAVAAALKADHCQICTDVDGVYTADPRIVPEARKIKQLCYEEMLELASGGSKVMQTRSVEYAKNYGVAFEVCSSFNQNIGTMIEEASREMEQVVVRGVTVDSNQLKVAVKGLPDKPGTAAELFTALEKVEVNVDMIVQNVGHNGAADLTFTVPKDDAVIAENTIKTFLKNINHGQVELSEKVSKLSVVGIGMRSHSGVAAKLFCALAKKDINIQLISTSEIKIAVLIDSDEANEGCRAVHDAFCLDNK